MRLLTGTSIVLTSVMNAGSKFWFACRIASLKGLCFESFPCAFVTCVKEIVSEWLGQGSVLNLKQKIRMCLFVSSFVGLLVQHLIGDAATGPHTHKSGS